MTVMELSSTQVRDWDAAGLWFQAAFPGLVDVRVRPTLEGGVAVTGVFGGSMLAVSHVDGGWVAHKVGVCVRCGTVVADPRARVWTRVSKCAMSSSPAPALRGAQDFFRWYGEQPQRGDGQPVDLADRACGTC